MQFDTALNVTWLLLGLLALASTARSALSDANRPYRASAWLHIVGVALIVAALFPYISATDDALRIEQFSSQHKHDNSGHHSRNDNLIRLYETLDSPLVCRTCEVILTFFFLSFVTASAARATIRVAPLTAGRSPPLGLS